MRWKRFFSPVSAANLETSRPNVVLTVGHYFSDTYVKVAMFNSIGQQLSKSKTSIRRSMCDPEYNENFVFQIIEFELPSVSLMFSVVNIKKMRRKEIIGWFSMGRDNTGEDEEAHWKEMIEAKGQPRKRWHILSAVDY